MIYPHSLSVSHIISLGCIGNARRAQVKVRTSSSAAKYVGQDAILARGVRFISPLIRSLVENARMLCTADFFLSQNQKAKQVLVSLSLPVRPILPNFYSS